MLNKIADPANLYLAWGKLKKIFKPGDVWFDQIEFARFEANLDSEFESIRNDINAGKYVISPIKPVGFPKSPKDGEIKTRQTFSLSVRDQLVWIATVNIIGPELDMLMPFWSFGNRLYRSVWYDTSSGVDELKFGWYRHSVGFLYRKWNQSWPRYRRTVSITTRVMAFSQKFKNDQTNFIKEILSDLQEINELEQNINLPENLSVKYWNKEYWEKDLTGNVFWASLDLEKFYPSIKLDYILKCFSKYLSPEVISEELLLFLKSLMQFPVDANDWSDEELIAIDLSKECVYFDSLPTGLLVSGFLANVAMLEIDELVNNRLKERKTIAHFRFVDDHIVLADSFDGLIEWIEEYERIVSEMLPGVRINKAKSEPNALRQYFLTDKVADEFESIKTNAEKETLLDPLFPSPLMTQTLAKVSNINKTEFDLLDDQEEDQLIADLEHLLLADIPEQELRKDTRISFAATMLSRIVPRKINDVNKLYKLSVHSAEIESVRFDLHKELEDIKNDSKKHNSLSDQIKTLDAQAQEVRKEIHDEESKLKRENLKTRSHVFKLLIKAVKENHSKVRLWTRLLEYCYNSGHTELERIFEEVFALKGVNASELSCEFIFAIIFDILAEQSIRIALIITDRNCSYLRHESAERYLSHLTSQSLMELVEKVESEAKRFYLKKSVALYQSSLSLASFWIKTHSENKDKELFQPVQNDSLYFDTIEKQAKKAEYRISDLFWWFTKKTLPLHAVEPNIIWEKAIEIVPLNEDTAWAIIAMFPGKIPPAIIGRIEEYSAFTKKYTSSAGWMFELTGSPKEVQTKLNKKSYINLYEWCKWTEKKHEDDINNSHGAFDPRLSEWTALSIVYQIADKLDKPQDIFYWYFNQSGFANVHPSNYLIPSNWMSLKDDDVDWPKWKSLMRNGVQLKEEDKFISDFRYKPLIEDPFISSPQSSIIAGLGMILFGLLCRDLRLPFIWNVQGQQLATLYLASQRVKQIPISSITYGIIESCFSIRNIDTRLVRNTQKALKQSSDFTDDTDTDLPPISTFKSLKERLAKSMAVLSRYQINVQDNFPRQLIPINLIQYSKKTNPFSDQEEETQVENS
jgi:hypothetical protein